MYIYIYIYIYIYMYTVYIWCIWCIYNLRAYITPYMMFKLDIHVIISMI